MTLTKKFQDNCKHLIEEVGRKWLIQKQVLKSNLWWKSFGFKGWKQGRKEREAEIINDLEEWAKNAGEDLLVTIRTVINTLKFKEAEQ